MGFDLGVIEGKYLRDLLDQPRALEDTLETMESSQQLSDLASRLNHGRFHRIVLTGMGSSFHALHPLNLQLIRHGFTVVMVETSELIHYQGHLFDPNTLMVAVSQSGQSAEMVRLTAVNRKRSTVIAVTNTPRSPLAERAAVTLFTQAGQESSVSCKTYVTALMTLKWLGDILCERNERQSRRELRNASPAVATYLSSWQGHVTSMTEMLSGIRHLFLVGRGASLAAVGTGALIIKESDHFPAEGMSSAVSPWSFRDVERRNPGSGVLGRRQDLRSEPSTARGHPTGQGPRRTRVGDRTAQMSQIAQPRREHSCNC